MQTVEYLSCKGLSVGYKDAANKSVLVHKDMYVRALGGELVALIGGNGIGKSTLLKTIAGFLSPLTGELLIQQKSISDFRSADLAKELSFVSTEQVHVANLTVEELVSLGRFPYTNWFGQLEEEDHRIVAEAIAKVGLTGYEKRLINRVSDGERQRAMIARALAQDTRIIVLDEPTAFLDIANKYEIMQILHELTLREGKCVILSTHDLNTALTMADRIWLMMKNEVLEGIPEEIAAGGYLDLLFPGQDRLQFDEERGDFKIKRAIGHVIQLVATPKEAKLVTRALERLGFEVVSYQAEANHQSLGELPVKVVQEQANWKIVLDGKEMMTPSLEALCRVLKQLTIQPGS